jgi:hypothetical protein
MEEYDSRPVNVGTFDQRREHLELRRTGRDDDIRLTTIAKGDADSFSPIRRGATA